MKNTQDKKLYTIRFTYRLCSFLYDFEYCTLATEDQLPDEIADLKKHYDVAEYSVTCED